MPGKLKILLVEDHPYSREAMGLWLSDRFEVVSACDGLEALEILKAQPDLQVVLTDWMMPRMDGMEFCRQARALVRERHLHIIVLTARTQREDLLTALRAGADAFVHKPVDLAEVQAQITVARRLIELQEQAEQRMDDLIRARRQVEMDLEAAGRIQRSMLPEVPPQAPGIRFAWLSESSGGVAGDLFGVAELGHGKVGLYTLDVCGSGVPAALLAVSVGWAMRPAGLLTRGEDGSLVALAPAEVARSLNRRFPVMSRSEQYFGLLYGLLDSRTLRFEIVRAGHPAPLLLAPEGTRPLPAPPGPPLGVVPDEELEVESAAHQLAPGHRVLLYTDGLLRALAGGRHFAEESDLAEFLDPLRHLTLEEILQALRSRIQEGSPEGPGYEVVVVAFEDCPESQEP